MLSFILAAAAAYSVATANYNPSSTNAAAAAREAAEARAAAEDAARAVEEAKRASIPKPAEDCVYIGDSVAIALHALDNGDDCLALVAPGADGTKIARGLDYYNLNVSDLAVVSIGSDAPVNSIVSYYDAALIIRDQIAKNRRICNEDELGKQVCGWQVAIIWVLPRNRQAANDIRRIAQLYGDDVIDLGSYKSNDGIHPTAAGYRAIRNRIDAIYGAILD